VGNLCGLEPVFRASAANTAIGSPPTASRVREPATCSQSSRYIRRCRLPEVERICRTVFPGEAVDQLIVVGRAFLCASEGTRLISASRPSRKRWPNPLTHVRSALAIAPGCSRPNYNKGGDADRYKHNSRRLNCLNNTRSASSRPLTHRSRRQSARSLLGAARLGRAVAERRHVRCHFAPPSCIVRRGSGQRRAAAWLGMAACALAICRRAARSPCAMNGICNIRGTGGSRGTGNSFALRLLTRIQVY